eukprot:g1290.t1
MGCCDSKDSTYPEKLVHLSKTPFFTHLNNDTLMKLAHFFEMKSYAEGDRLDEEAYIIVADGELSVSTLIYHHTNKMNVEEILCQKKKGDFFAKGENQAKLVERDQKKVAAVIDTTIIKAMTKTTVLVLHHSSLQSFLRMHPKAMPLIETILHDDILLLLKKVPFFEDQNAKFIKLLAEVCSYTTIEKGKVVMEEGSVANGFYMVIEGELSVDAATATRTSSVFFANHGKIKRKNTVHIANLKKGNWFGEMALITKMPRSATVTATSRSFLLYLDPKDFLNILKMDESRWKDLAHMCQLRDHETGTELVQEGKRGETFYILVFGQVSVFKNGALLSTLSSGDYFGEIALVANRDAQASIRAISDVVLLELDKVSFLKFFAETPDALIDFELKVLGPEADLIHIIRHPVGLDFFKKNLEQEYSDENVNFWEQVQIYRKLYETEKKVEEALTLAKEIRATYVEEGSPKPINIPHKMRDALLKKLDDETAYDALIFDDAQDEIYQLMNHDNFARFRKSPLFADLLEAVGAYSQLNDHHMLDYENRNEELLDTAGKTNMSVKTKRATMISKKPYAKSSQVQPAIVEE